MPYMHYISAFFVYYWSVSIILFIIFIDSYVERCQRPAKRGIITCQNLHFGKYVGLTVCYLPKFTFWQVCWFNGLSVCLFVRLFKRSRITLEPFEISSPKLVHRCILVAVPCYFFSRSKVKGQRSRSRGHRKVKVRNRRNSVNFWATAKFKKPQCSTPHGPSLWHHQLPVSRPV